MFYLFCFNKLFWGIQLLFLFLHLFIAECVEKKILKHFLTNNKVNIYFLTLFFLECVLLPVLGERHSCARVPVRRRQYADKAVRGRQSLAVPVDADKNPTAHEASQAQRSLQVPRSARQGDRNGQPRCLGLRQ